MPFLPEVNYNPDLKVWSGVDEEPIFSPNLSLGEITFNEMRRHPQLIAQVSWRSIIKKGHYMNYIFFVTDLGHGEYCADPGGTISKFQKFSELFTQSEPSTNWYNWNHCQKLNAHFFCSVRLPFQWTGFSLYKYKSFPGNNWETLRYNEAPSDLLWWRGIRED